MSEVGNPPSEDKLKHPCFPQPTDGSVRVWRYLDLAKLIWLLRKKQLYLSRLDLLDDPHEGSTPQVLVQLREKQFTELGAAHVLPQLSALSQQNRRSTYVSCWQWGNEESEAMWRLYCPNGSGVAIQSTYQALVASVAQESDCYIGLVRYIDYETDGFPPNNLFYSVMHKRLSFSHEREVRLVKTLPDHWGLGAPPGPNGISIDWRPEESVHAIYVNPYAPDYYRDVVDFTIQHMAPQLVNRIHWSRMRAGPMY